MSKSNELIHKISLINLLPSVDHERFNEYVKEAYKIIRDNDISQKIVNTFLLAINDYNALRKNSASLERKEFTDNKMKEHSIEVVGKEFYLSSDQLNVWNSINESGTNWIFSMPTSFGKSLLIRLLAEKRNNLKKRTIIISPTISLMNEYHDSFDEAGISSSTSSLSSENVLILTQERALTLELRKDDVVIVDEAYVLGNNDSRAGILYHFLFKAIKRSIDIFMFMPNIMSANKLFKKEQFSNHFKYSELFRSLSTREEIMKKGNRKKVLQEVELNSKRKYIIFDYKYKHKEDYKYIESSSTKLLNIDAVLKDVFDYLNKEFGPQFFYTRALKNGVAISNGSLPKQFRYLSELLYKLNYINVMIANSTVTKGVNLSPDAIYIFSKNFQSPKQDLDIFELRNSIGRAGRYSDEIEKRIGSVNIVADGKTYEIFKENKENFTRDSIPHTMVHSSNEVEIVSNFKFDVSKENIDWVQTKFGIKENEIKEFINKYKSEFKEYIDYKYNSKKSHNKKFANVWEILISNESIKNTFVRALLKTNEYSDKQDYDSKESYVLNDLKYQGFNEALAPRKTFYISAKEELSSLINKNQENKKSGRDVLYFYSKDATSVTYRPPTDREIEKKSVAVINEDIKKTALGSDIIDHLILRKANVWSRFVESTLTPLDLIIAQSIGMEIVPIEVIDNCLEKNGISSDFRSVVVNGIAEIESISETDVQKVIDETSILQTIIKMKKMKKNKFSPNNNTDITSK